MKITLSAIVLSLSLLSCGDNATSIPQQETRSVFQNEAHEFVYKMSQKVGNYNKLSAKKDVIYTYTYQTPDGKKDVVTEKYIFDGELSYGAYNIHERTFPQLAGLVEQGYDGSEFWIKHNGTILEDNQLLKGVEFNRPTNFYWFTMMQKLLDDGITYEHLGEKSINDTDYDIVKVTFDIDNKETSDIYQLYINKKTQLVDQFLFTVADYGVIETPYLMVLDYETIDGITLATQRKYKTSTWEADVSDAPWIVVTWSDITFDNNLTKAMFQK